MIQPASMVMRHRTLCICLLVFAAASYADSSVVQLSEEADNAEEQDIGWHKTVEQSLRFLTIQNGVRLTQTKTYRELDGPFWRDYAHSVRGLRGWEDGDGSFTNYVAHPMQGAATGYIFLQNSPDGRSTEFASDSRYWSSRLKAMGWAAVYSTQFELGPYSEASIGNVGSKRGTMGYVDLVMTPAGGLGWILAEDAVDRYVLRRVEDHTSRGMVRFLRIALNPTRSVANLMRGKKPWRRDYR